MNILGVYFGHDANAALVRDGEVIFHVEASRHTRRKHDHGCHGQVIQKALDWAGVTWKDIDVIAIGGSTIVDYEIDPPPIYEELKKVIHSHRLEVMVGYNVDKNPKDWDMKTGDPLQSIAEDEIKIEGKPVKVVLLSHHLSHAAQVYYTSPYSDATIFSWDGGGDGAYTLAIRGKGNQLSEADYTGGMDKSGILSIGGAWTNLPRLYTENDFHRKPDFEGKIMGHAAYGTPQEKWIDFVRDCMVKYGTPELYSPCGSEQWRNQVKGITKEVDFTSFDAESAQNFSASLQMATEQVMLELIADKTATIAENICLVGGCAYNCCANGKIFKQYSNVFVSNCPHDGGLSLGAALFVWHHLLDNEFVGIEEFSPYQGLDYLPEVNPQLRKHSNVVDQVVDDLVAGKIVAWYNGRSESGKRALGNRSILADPRIMDIKTILNKRVKQREWFRPFAPSVLEGYNVYHGEIPPSSYMSFAVPLGNGMELSLPGIRHVDGTVRPQVATQRMNPVYYEILDKFRQATDVPMLLNTSFNIQEPIVETPEDAQSTFEKSGMDVLYLCGKRIVK